ncbi:fructosamine kinase family protein [Clostridium baratii]|uniref:fructosamine kinase family protein n=1 Tax=Clostridium baratii TaxID=1561 RepID=UPI002A757A50|nr:fructosamine kinase family protein [Clostridium baratii]MDY3207212.1 fructosamine kinase family protein [Clostridium baratii]
MNKTSKIYKELKKEELNKIVENYFGIGIKFKERLISGGLFNTTYYIEIPEENKKVILRVGPVNRDLLMPFELNLMKGEEYVYKLCENNKIPCSNVLICDTEKKIINRDYMMVEYVDSKALSEIKISEDIENKLYYEVGQHISKLHSITSEKFGRVYDVSEDNGFSLWSEYLIDEISKLSNKIRKFNIFDDEQLELFKSCIYKYKEILDEVKTPHLVHGDLWAGNILVEDKNNNFNIAAIIDADRAIFGDIEFEFANPWITNKHFIKGYGKELSNDTKSEIRKKIYSLLYSLIDSYVWYVEYDNNELGLENKEKSLKLVEELLK